MVPTSEPRTTVRRMAEGLDQPARHPGDLHRAGVLGDGAALDHRLIISAIANSPISAGTRCTPSQRYWMPKVKRTSPSHVVVADEGDHQAEAAGDEAAQHLAARRRGDDDKAEHRQQEEFGRAEQQHQFLGDRQHGQHGNRADDAAERVGARRRADGEPGLALLRQRIAVEAGGGVGRGARRVQQDRGDRAAHRHRAHDAAGQRHRRERLEAVGQRHEQRQRRGAAEARNSAEDQADDHAKREKRQLPELQQAFEAGEPNM